MAKRKKGKVVKMTSPENYIRERARTLPIHECLINPDWEVHGMASIIVSRKHTNGNLTAGLYLVDLKCLGVKDAQYFFNIYPFEYNNLLERRGETQQLEKVDYTLAHNIIYAGMEFAEDYGFKPHKDFSVAKFILEEDTEDIELIEITCGENGVPFFVRGPLESDMDTARIIAQLEKTAGRGNYGFVDQLSDEEWDDDWDDDGDDTIEEEDLDDDDYSFDDMWDDDPFDLDLDFSQKDVQNSSTFEFKIQMKDISNPPVWRRLTVPSYFRFYHFHYVIQVAFGWTDSHLFQFSENRFDSEKVITAIYKDEDVGDAQQTEAKDVLLSDIFNDENQEYIYIYDFGDSWEHQIILEKVVPEVTRVPFLLDGEGACPPEDCGGVGGYEQLKKIMADKSHPEYEEFKQWLGMIRHEEWDPEAFDAEETQFELNEVFNR